MKEYVVFAWLSMKKNLWIENVPNVQMIYSNIYAPQMNAEYAKWWMKFSLMIVIVKNVNMQNKQKKKKKKKGMIIKLKL